MITSYVDLSAVGTGHTGDIGNPYSWADWLVYANTPFTDDNTFLVKGSCSATADLIFNCNAIYGVTIKSWLDIPHTIYFGNYKITPSGGCASFSWDRGILGWNQKHIILSTGDPITYTFTSCFISDFFPSIGGNALFTSGTINLIGCTVVGTSDYLMDSGGVIVILQSCHVEGFRTNVRNGGTLSASYTSFYAVPAIGTFTDLGNNKDYHGSSTALPANAYNSVLSLSLPEDIYPNGGTALLGNGDPSLIGTEDIRGTARSATPNIGSEDPAAVPTLSISPTYFSFGNQLLDSTTSTVVRITNTGTANLGMGTVTGLIGTDWRMVDNFSDATLIPSDFIDSTMTFNPASLDMGESVTLSIPSNDPASPTLWKMDGTCEQSIISVSPTFYSFGPHPSSSVTNTVVRITNNGNVSAHIGSVTGQAIDFGIIDNWTDATIAPSTYADSTIQYTPYALNTGESETLAISSDDPASPLLFKADGTCQQPVLLVVPSSEEYGTVIKNSTTDRTVNVVNNGNVDMHMGTMINFGGPYSIPVDNVSDATIAPDGTRTFVARYHPTALGENYGTDDIFSDDPAHTAVSFNLHGICQQSIIGVSPDHWSFGLVEIDSTNDKLVTVSNSGNSNLVMGSLTGLAAPYSLVDDSVSGVSIAPSGSKTVKVRYLPTTLGHTIDVLSLPSNDPVIPTFAFTVDGTSGERDISVSPTSWNAGSVAVGSSNSTVITVTNIGAFALTMTPVSGLAAPFTVANDHVSSAVLSPGDSSTLTVVFTPSAPTNYADTLIVNSNDPDTPAFNVSVFGSASGSNPIFSTERHASQREIRDYITGYKIKEAKRD